MGMTADDYLHQLQALLPSGAAWPRHPEAILTKVLGGLSESFGRFDSRVWALLLTELNPTVTDELLESWEALCGLPGDCTPADQTTDDRRAAVLQRLNARGGQSPAYFVQQAAALGFTAEVEEYAPASCESSCEDSLNDDEPTEATCESSCESALRVEGWRFVWQVRVTEPLTTVTEMDCESPCDTALASWGDTQLECTIRHLAPAHTLVRFAYEVE